VGVVFDVQGVVPGVAEQAAKAATPMASIKMANPDLNIRFIFVTFRSSLVNTTI
jgi:hypothetical protein